MLEQDQFGLMWDKPYNPQYRSLLLETAMTRRLWSFPDGILGEVDYGFLPGNLLTPYRTQDRLLLIEFQQDKAPVQ